jgi:hypothetical protein
MYASNTKMHFSGGSRISHFAKRSTHPLPPAAKVDLVNRCVCTTLVTHPPYV